MRLITIPNLITLGNLFCGCLAIIFALGGDLRTSAYFVLIAGFLDFFDGFAARVLKSNSPIGGDLDSLADMVTFGVVPGIFYYKLLCDNFVCAGEFNLWAGLGFVFTMCAALRLAKYNVSEDQSEMFRGMPTPSATLFIIGIPFWYESGWYLFLADKLFLFFWLFLISFLMISNVPMFAYKFKNASLKNNWFTYAMMIFPILLLLTMGLKALTILIVVYIIGSFIYFRINKIAE